MEACLSFNNDAALKYKHLCIINFNKHIYFQIIQKEIIKICMPHKVQFKSINIVITYSLNNIKFYKL